MQLNNIFTIIFLSGLVLSIFFKIFLDFINYSFRRKNQNIIPKELKGFIDQKKLSLINKYSNEKSSFSLIEYFIEKIFLFIILFMGVIPIYYNFLIKKFTNIYFLGVIFFGGFFLVNFLIDIPFNLYFNFKIEKKYNFNKMTIAIWITDLIKKILLTVGIGIIIIIPLIFFIYNFKSLWWIFLWFFFLLFSIIIQIIYPTLIAPLFNKFIPLKNEELKIKIEKLLTKSGFKSRGIFEMDASKRSSHSNAYFTGFGNSKRIVLFDSLLKNHSDDEILSALAHELGHFKYKHILINFIISLFLSFIGLLLAFLLINNNVLYDAFGFGSNFNIEKSKFVGLLLLSILIEPISFFMTPFSSILSRIFEYQADAFSIKNAKNKKYLINTLKKLVIDNLSNIYPSKVYAWFYYSHPPILDRINYIKNYKEKKK